jgi:hypothetical protein
MVDKRNATIRSNAAQTMPSAYSRLSQPNAVAGTVAGIASIKAATSRSMMVSPNFALLCESNEQFFADDPSTIGTFL